MLEAWKSRHRDSWQLVHVWFSCGFSVDQVLFKRAIAWKAVACAAHRRLSICIDTSASSAWNGVKRSEKSMKKRSLVKSQWNEQKSQSIVVHGTEIPSEIPSCQAEKEGPLDLVRLHRHSQGWRLCQVFEEQSHDLPICPINCMTSWLDMVFADLKLEKCFKDVEVWKCHEMLAHYLLSLDMLWLVHRRMYVKNTVTCNTWFGCG